MFKSMTKLALAVAAVAGATSSAQAFVYLRLADLGPDQTTIQAQVTCDTSVAQNNAVGGNCSTADGFFGYTLNGTSISYLGFVGSFSVGSFTVSTTAGTTNIPGTPTGAYIDAATNGIKNTAALGTGPDYFYIDFRGYNFFFPDGAVKTFYGSASFSGAQRFGDDPQEIETYFYADPNNGGSTSAVADNCDMTVAAPSDNCYTPTQLWNDIPGSSFSLRTQQYFTLNGQSLVNATSNVAVGSIPEPMTLSLVGAALLGAAVAARRNKKA